MTRIEFTFKELDEAAKDNVLEALIRSRFPNASLFPGIGCLIMEVHEKVHEKLFQGGKRKEVVASDQFLYVDIDPPIPAKIRECAWRVKVSV